MFAQHVLLVVWMTVFPSHGQRMDELRFQMSCVLSPEKAIVCAVSLPPGTRGIPDLEINPDCGKWNGT